MTTQWAGIVERELLPAVVDYCSENPNVLVSFLTGSFVRGRHHPTMPNVNIYFISTAGDANALRIGLGRLWAEVAATLKTMDLGFHVDCHPYTVTYRAPETLYRPTLTLTTKVLDSASLDRRLSLPPTIGAGWLASNRILSGDGDLMRVLAATAATPMEWLHAYHEALARYRGILDHLPNAIPWTQSPVILSREAVWYAREALKDCVGIGLSIADVVAGRGLEILHDKAEEALFRTLGWIDVADASQKLAEAEARLDRGELEDEAAALETWLLSSDIWDIVWRRLVNRVRREVGDEAPWLTRVNAFV